MEQDVKKRLSVGAGVVGALGAMGLLVAGSAVAQPASQAEVAGAAPDAMGAVATGDVAQMAQETRVQHAVVEGEFSYTQALANTNEEISYRIGGASAYLCGSTLMGPDGQDKPGASVEDWAITVDGAVASGFTATFGELCQTSEVQTLLMGCTCAANPADGAATVNAEVTGIPLTIMLNMAGVEPGANTVVFTSADGYEVALPLAYVAQRYCPLVFAVNGSDLADSVGGTNQLWLGSTSARYFARDIVRITVEARDEVPASPASEEGRAEYANLPNIGVAFGGEVA